MNEPQKKKTRYALVGGLLCLGLLISCSGILSIVLAAIKRSDGYTAAVTLAKTDTRVIALLGEPITEGAFPMGQVNVVNGVETVDLHISLNGPKTSGVLQAKGQRRNGPKGPLWTWEQLDFGPDEAPKIDLRTY